MQSNQSTSVNNDSKWLGYYNKTSQSSKPWETLAKTIELFQEEKIEAKLAVDLGCGVGKDTAYLVERGWKVIAMDAEKVAEEFLFKKIPKSKQNDVTFVVATFEDFRFPDEVQVINASYALPFCNPANFDNVMQRITAALSVGGRFCGHFLGPNDSWEKDKAKANTSDRAKVFLDQAQVKEYFKDFKIEYYREVEEDGASGSGPKHWHLHHIIAKKV